MVAHEAHIVLNYHKFPGLSIELHFTKIMITYIHYHFEGIDMFLQSVFEVGRSIEIKPFALKPLSPFN